MSRHESKDKANTPRREPTLWETLDLPPEPSEEDEKDMPPVDRNLLLALYRGELSKEEARRATDLVLRFRSWERALAEIAVQEFLSRPEG